ncbi:ATP-binding protein [Streptomyces sp. NPDC057552]|uniref:ATP-binding protein n=1 Tax=Streptomyces sp. NPDC057552 TaxID=3350537 RepID=UPI0036AB97E8
MNGTARAPALPRPTDGMFKASPDASVPARTVPAMVETGVDPLPAYSATLPSTPEAVGDARRLVASALGAWGVGDARDAAELVVSELMANAVLHVARGAVRVTVALLGDRRVRVAVADRSRTCPAPCAAGRDQESGRGLEIVEALSGGRWGVDLLPQGKRVWATLGPAKAEPDE